MGCLRLTYREEEPTLKVVHSNFSTERKSSVISLEISEKSCAGAYRYGFNGKEHDDEIKGNGLHVDFGARAYDTRLGRWFSLDPKMEKYPYASPYNYVLNSPIVMLDPDGEEAILFTDIAGVGHAFLGVMNSEGVFTIYTYGQYGQGKDSDASKPAGEGALIRLVGTDAWDYLNAHMNDDHYDIRSFYLSDNEVDETKVAEYFDKIIDDPKAELAEVKNDVKYVQTLESKAVKYKTYTGVTIPACTENCVTVADEGLEAGGSDIIGIEWLPIRLFTQLKVKDALSSDVKDVSKEFKTTVEGAGEIKVSDFNPANKTTDDLVKETVDGLKKEMKKEGYLKE